jgi:hypothetical protein
MNARLYPIALVLLVLVPCLCTAAEPSFSGAWSLDSRTGSQLTRDDICGSAGFTLRQTGNDIRGEHYNFPIGCGRVNEGGFVRGIATGSKAVLVVKSGRNGAMAIGTAELQDGHLVWRLEDYVSSGEPQGDDLILAKGVLAPKDGG